MRFPSAVFGPAGSLRRGVVSNVIAALSLCIVLAIIVMISEFYEGLENNQEEALIEEAREIIGQIEPDAPQFGLNNGGLRFIGAEGAYRYTVFDGAGLVIIGGETSPAIRAQLDKIELDEPEPVDLPGDRIGMGLRARINAVDDVTVLVSTYSPATTTRSFNSISYVIKEQLWWVALGILMVLGAAIFATRRALAPLDRLSVQAAQIGPEDTEQRLTTDRVPTEITPLINAVNGAFDRLESGYRTQRDFSSNVAHEIRTPLAVLRSSVDRINDPELKKSLLQDVARLDQIFQQLIDLARADAALKSRFVAVDLRGLAVATAGEMAQVALRGGHTLSVTGAQQVTVHGSPGLLGIALRNVIQNALQYTPAGSDVEIEILNNPAGWRVKDQGPGVPDGLKSVLFERFNRGEHVNESSKGSGIGLAIVMSVAKSHDATADIQDRVPKGSIFSFIFKE